MVQVVHDRCRFCDSKHAKWGQHKSELKDSLEMFLNAYYNYQLHVLN